MTTIHRTPGLSVWNKIFAAVLLIFGLAMAVGGGYLAAVGGSWYYLLAGAGSIIAALLIFARRRSAVYWFALVFIGTLLWTIYESGLDYWGWVPRFDLMLLLGIVFAFQLPGVLPHAWCHIYRRIRRRRYHSLHRAERNAGQRHARRR